MNEIPNWFVVCMGIGTVFVGLICIVIICDIMSRLSNLGTVKKEKNEEPIASQITAPQPIIENRQEILAAVCAVAAEELGTDISAIRVLSFKKL